MPVILNPSKQKSRGKSPSRQNGEWLPNQEDATPQTVSCAAVHGMNVAFAEELKAWGPQAPARELSRSEAEAYCRTLARTHYENFPVVSWLLPRHLHQHFYNVYAYCRWADDLGDEIADAKQATELLAWWRDQLQACYHGSATHPVFIALGPTITEFGIPQQPFEDLLSAFEQDQRVKKYENYVELRDYCRRSADPVGRIVLYLCRAFSERNVAWSDSICTGLQLANFWQDVARDFDIGRVYLPRESRLRFRLFRRRLGQPSHE